MGALLQPMERAFPGKMIQGAFADSFGAHIVEVALVPGAEEPGARPQGVEKQCDVPLRDLVALDQQRASWSRFR